MTYNKDMTGDFTDEAIEAVEKELTSLAEKIQVPEEELGERIADAAFRRGFDTIEEELIVMRTTAVDLLHDRAKERISQIEDNKTVKKILMAVAGFCAGAGFIFLIVGMFRGIPMNYLIPALVSIALFLAMLFATINAQAIDEWLLRETNIDLELALEINDSSKKLLATVKEAD